jgi:hypothetical protein
VGNSCLIDRGTGEAWTCDQCEALHVRGEKLATVVFLVWKQRQMELMQSWQSRWDLGLVENHLQGEFAKKTGSLF